MIFNINSTRGHTGSLLVITKLLTGWRRIQTSEVSKTNNCPCVLSFHPLTVFTASVLGPIVLIYTIVTLYKTFMYGNTKNTGVGTTDEPIIILCFETGSVNAMWPQSMFNEAIQTCVTFS